MKKYLKNVICILLSVLSVSFCTVFTSCSKDEKELPKLTWYIPGDNLEDTNEVEEAANEIIIPKIGARLELKFIDIDKYNDIMNMKVSVKENFDLCFTGYVNPYRRIVMSGGLLELDDYIDKMPELKSVIPDYAWDGAKINQKIYAVPNMQFIAYCKAISVDRSLAEKYNLNVSEIKHITDMEPFFEQIKQNEPDYYAYDPSWGISCMYKTNEDGYPKNVIDNIFMTIDENGNHQIKPNIEIKEFEDAIYKTHEWYKKGYIREDIGLSSSNGSYKKAAAVVNMYKPGMEGEQLAGGKDNISIRIGDIALGNGAGTTAMTGVGKWSENPQKAIELIELVNTDKELFNILAFGIEGKHYIKTGENRAKLIPKSENGYFVNAAWKFGSQFQAYILPGQQDNVWEETKALNDSAQKAEFYDIKYSTENIEDELSRVATIYEQYDFINNGSRNPDEYLDEFREKLHEVGIDKVCEELSEQLSEYLNSH